MKSRYPDLPYKVGDRVKTSTPHPRQGVVVGLFPDGVNVQLDNSQKGFAIYMTYQWLEPVAEPAQ